MSLRVLVLLLLFVACSAVQSPTPTPAAASSTFTATRLEESNTRNNQNGFWTPFRKREIRLDSLDLPSRTRRQRIFRLRQQLDKGIITSTFNMPTSTATTANDVIWFVPNLIGYTRVVMALAAFTLIVVDSSTYWALATILYCGSFVGDLFDGWAARKLDQCSVMGGLLDMVTDRCATLGFLYLLGGEYTTRDVELGFPFYRLVCILLLSIL